MRPTTLHVARHPVSWKNDNEKLEPAPIGSGQFKLIDIPIDDFHAPEPFVAARFWKAAREIAERIENDDRIFIHCGAGIGRTGMFAVAVLMQQGYTYEDAYQEIYSVRSHPEMPSQIEFLKQGPERHTTSHDTPSPAERS